MDIPFEPEWFGIKMNIHLILEYLAFFVGFRYYLYLKRRKNDLISDSNRLSILIGAIFGALIGSRVMGYLEHPVVIDSMASFAFHFLSVKTIMGGLFGGLLGVELIKKIIKEEHSSGDLFTLPIILGIVIGRIGCFFAGTNEFTYGIQTSMGIGIDLGDGLPRHPLALYEIFFLAVLWVWLSNFRHKLEKDQGLLFKYFMISYFGFRFFIEFIKPNTFLVFGLSSIQYLCILCWIYYWETIYNAVRKK